MIRSFNVTPCRCRGRRDGLRRAAVSIIMTLAVHSWGDAAVPVIRLATFNTSLHRNAAGELVAELTGGRSPQARQIAEIIQRLRPSRPVAE